MKLYEYYRSSCSYRLRIALNIKNIAAEQMHINLLKGEQSTDDYIKINPQGTVPTLVDGDVSIYQSIAALEYLEESHPLPPLLPDNLNDKAYIRTLCHHISSGIQPVNNIGVLNYLKNTLNISEEQKNKWLHDWIGKGLSSLESMLDKSEDFCFGNSITMADICLVPQVYNAMRFECNMSNLPKITSIYEKCMQQDEFRKASPENHPFAS